ncbi:YjbE family integral membrane protein [Paenibacillus phyllosphaerae]|uniref:YjbE family integral membrane protein n=1 Tax=Paenibacillus phyllosphaerae TaxID=274593 RepID=A0A7W5B3E1_9BACL|nr:TerC family protein [Paenibacillus phyllosphaerae]MBB3113674.1 YjbE family integral membrane protein [Paenibacillus phyllosphaerae]
MTGEFWLGLLELILINIVLSGDNAVVIALACRNLPSEQQKKAIFWGSMGAVLLRVVLTFVAVWLMHIPLVQVVGSILLLFIAIKLLKGDDAEEHIQSGANLKEAIRTIIIADVVMSLDNVLAVAGAANNNMVLIIIGLAISIPLIIWASQLLMALMTRFPTIVILGAALLGYTAGEMILSDRIVGEHLEAWVPHIHYALPILLAVFVVVTGKLGGRKDRDKHEPHTAS